MKKQELMKGAAYSIAFLSGLIFSNAVGSFLLGNYAVSFLSVIASLFGIFIVKNLRAL